MDDPQLRRGTTVVKPGSRYLLKNSVNRHFLYGKSRNFGVNLGFTDDAEPSTAAKVVQWQFHNRDQTPIEYDQPVAIRCKEGYLRYGAREFGINLVWSNTPDYGSGCSAARRAPR